MTIKVVFIIEDHTLFNRKSQKNNRLCYRILGLLKNRNILTNSDLVNIYLKNKMK